MKCIN